jgi:hypothetical protein
MNLIRPDIIQINFSNGFLNLEKSTLLIEDFKSNQIRATENNQVICFTPFDLVSLWNCKNYKPISGLAIYSDDSFIFRINKIKYNIKDKKIKICFKPLQNYYNVYKDIKTYKKKIKGVLTIINQSYINAPINNHANLCIKFKKCNENNEQLKDLLNKSYENNKLLAEKLRKCEQELEICREIKSSCPLQLSQNIYDDIDNIVINIDETKDGEKEYPDFIKQLNELEFTP